MTPPGVGPSRISMETGTCPPPPPPQVSTCPEHHATPSESMRFEKLMEHFKNEDDNIDFM
ncbi:hypothetical protein NHX12_015635, partial [Muraenolepis orangiensis]